MDSKGFNISGKEHSLEEMLSKLKFISRIKEGDKINVGSMSIVKPDYYSRICRTMSGETRDDGLEFIRIVIRKSIELAQYYMNCKEEDCEFNRDVADLIIKNINDAKKGIENYSKTYGPDVKFATELETILETTNIKIGKNTKKAD